MNEPTAPLPDSAKYVQPTTHAKPTCPKCDSIMYIKVRRYPDGKLKLRCLDCEHEAIVTSEEYYAR